MIGFIIGFIICYIVTIIVGTFATKQTHPTASTIECMRKFKLDLTSLLGEFFCMRHVFDLSLQEGIYVLLNTYNHIAFPIGYAIQLLHNVPAICISFVPNRDYTDEEIYTLCKLMRLKFSQYIQCNSLKWNYFIEFHRLENHIEINLYYEEFFFDKKPFRERYKIAVKEQTSTNYGVLHDEALDKELRNVE